MTDTGPPPVHRGRPDDLLPSELLLVMQLRPPGPFPVSLLPVVPLPVAEPVLLVAPLPSEVLGPSRPDSAASAPPPLLESSLLRPPLH